MGHGGNGSPMRRDVVLGRRVTVVRAYGMGCQRGLNDVAENGLGLRSGHCTLDIASCELRTGASSAPLRLASRVVRDTPTTLLARKGGGCATHYTMKAPREMALIGVARHQGDIGKCKIGFDDK